MSIDSAPGISQILCITVDNSPLTGAFLPSPGSVPITALSSPSVARTATYNPPSRPPAWAPATLAQQAGQYLAGERVQAAVAVATGGLRPVSTGWWSLPSPDASGACSSAPSAFVGVRSPVPPRQCWRPAAPLTAATCEAWGAQRATAELRLAVLPGKTTSLTTAPSSADWLPVTLGTAWTGNASSGALSQSGALSSAASLSPVFSPCSCAGVLTALAYTVHYNGLTGALTSATADVVLASLSLSASDCAAGASLSPPLSVSLEWVDDASPAPAPALGRSGAPGYLLGAPVLAGAMVTASGAPASGALAAGDKLAVLTGAPAGSRLAVFSSGANAGAFFSSYGLSVRGPGAGGACAAPPAAASAATWGPATGTDSAQPVPVGFGEDLAVSCTVSLTLAELAGLCAALSAAPPAYTGLWPVNGTGSTPTLPSHVGILGNAHPWKAWQWTGISAPAGGYPPAPVSYDAATGVCSGVPATLALEFLWAAVGEAGNPQAQVLGVRYRYVSDSWAFGREDVRAVGAGGAQTFAFTTTVTWTQYGSSAPAVYVAPPPNVLPKLPADLWYPFG